MSHDIDFYYYETHDREEIESRMESSIRRLTGQSGIEWSELMASSGDAASDMGEDLTTIDDAVGVHYRTDSGIEGTVVSVSWSGIHCGAY